MRNNTQHRWGFELRTLAHKKVGLAYRMVVYYFIICMIVCEGAEIEALVINTIE